VDFYANGAPVGTDTAAPYSVTWTTDLPGSYSLTAVATDDQGASNTSNAVTITVTPPPGRVNVALAVNGATAVASSTYSNDYPASGVNNGDRRGLQWGKGGGWVDGTPNVWPDWLEVQFNGLQTIGEINVFGVQDNYLAPSDPTPTMTFSQYGVRDFTVQYWTGSAWQTVPSGAVSGNTFVWRQFTFAPITTSRIRISIINGLSSSSRLVEVEAYTATGG
jgi:Bacterial Ig domain